MQRARSRCPCCRGASAWSRRRRGAAVRDIVRILRRRFPNLHLIVYPVRVQGEGAAEEIVAALNYFNRKKSVDVILLARGGGIDRGFVGVQ